MAKLGMYIFFIIGFCATIIMILVANFLLHYMYFRLFKKLKPIPYEGKRFIRASAFKRLLFDFPHRFAEDQLIKNPNDFPYYGLHMFIGEQGSGKTIALTEFLLRTRLEYPKCQVNTNMGYIYQNNKITHWKQIVERTNGTLGVIECLDELQAWFSSNQSKDFPLEMLGEVSQQRKQRKMLCGTAQVFERISKPIREQTSFVYVPRTFFGCITWVRVTKPQYWSDEKHSFSKYEKQYFFVQTKELREAYNTYERIKKYAKDGFKSDTSRLLEKYLEKD